MSFYFEGELIVDKKQKQRMVCYLELIGGDLTKVENVGDQRYLSGFLAAFDNDPEKAAQAYVSANEKGDKAMIDHFQKMMKKVPFPEKENFFLKFHSIEQGEAYHEKIKAESMALSQAIFKQEFLNQVEAYHISEINKSESLQ